VDLSSSQLSERNREDKQLALLGLTAKPKPEDWPHITMTSAAVEGK